LYNPFESWTFEGVNVAANVVVAVTAALGTYLLVADRFRSEAESNATDIVARERQKLSDSGRLIGPRTPFVTAMTSNGAACVIKVVFSVERYSRAADNIKDFELRPTALEIMAPHIAAAVRGHTSSFALPGPEGSREREQIVSIVVPATDAEFKAKGLHLTSLRLDSIICTKDLL